MLTSSNCLSIMFIQRYLRLIVVPAPMVYFPVFRLISFCKLAADAASR